jgi:LacI family transcriptional regulator, repressor for deo operon, udp, cdd, tsx, nupC, and nupG
LCRNVTALICGSDVLALGAIRGARRMGLPVPGQVSVVGNDDSAFMACTDPPLTNSRPGSLRLVTPSELLPLGGEGFGVKGFAPVDEVLEESALGGVQ